MKQILIIATKVVAGLGSLAILYGAFVFFDNMQDDIVDIKEAQVEYKDAVDTTLYIVRMYDERILANEKAIEYNSGQVEVLRDSYLTYIKNDSSLTKSVFVEYMDPFLEYIKKNSSSIAPSLQTPSEYGSESNADITGNMKQFMFHKTL